mgnify:CR=1 FL=1
MMYRQKVEEIRDYIIIDILRSNIKSGDKVKDKKFFTSKFKINPNYYLELIDLLKKENIIDEKSDGYYYSFDNHKLGLLKNEYLNRYINDFIENLDKIGLSLDDAMEILKLRSLANG